MYTKFNTLPAFDCLNYQIQFPQTQITLGDQLLPVWKKGRYHKHRKCFNGNELLQFLSITC